MDQMSWWDGTRLVVARGLADALRSRSVRTTTAILLVVGLAVVFVPRWVNGGAHTYTVGSVQAPSAELRHQLDAMSTSAGFTLRYSTFPGAEAAKLAVRNGDATVAISGDRLFVRSDAPGALAALVTQALVTDARLAAMRAAGLTPQEIATVVGVTPPRQVEVGPAQDEGRGMVGFLIGIVLYLALMLSGQAISLNVGIEKSTRIAEVLLAVLRPSQLLVGNVIGIGVQTLVQFLALAIPIVGSIVFTDGLQLPHIAATDIVLGVVWFVIGYLVYAFLFAALAALADKATEVGAATMPVTVVLVIVYLAAVTTVQQDPGAPISVGLSLFPLSSVMAMPIRWATGQVGVWELALSMMLAVAAAVALGWFGSRVYARALVVTGRRLHMRELLARRGTA